MSDHSDWLWMSIFDFCSQMHQLVLGKIGLSSENKNYLLTSFLWYLLKYPGYNWDVLWSVHPLKWYIIWVLLWIGYTIFYETQIITIAFAGVNGVLRWVGTLFPTRLSRKFVIFCHNCGGGDYVLYHLYCSHNGLRWHTLSIIFRSCGDEAGAPW